jgi:hypothetical protein
LNISSHFDVLNRNAKDPDVTLVFLQEEIVNSFLSIAERDKRNGTSSYQIRHIEGPQATAEREKQPNWEIPDHFKKNLTVDALSSPDRYLVLGVGDLTANLLRPSWDARKDNNFFCLQYEPYEQLKKEKHPYTSFMMDKNNVPHIQSIYFVSQEDKIIPTDAEGQDLSSASNYLFCSIPLIRSGNKVSLAEMAFWDYDLRHFFTMEKEMKEPINELYQKWMKPDYYHSLEQAFETYSDKPYKANWYHAVLGINYLRKEIIIFHRTCNIPGLQDDLLEYGVDDAVLLDSGGSSVIWCNWLFGNYLAHHWYFRPERGSVMVFQLTGENSLYNNKIRGQIVFSE